METQTPSVYLQEVTKAKLYNGFSILENKTVRNISVYDPTYRFLLAYKTHLRMTNAWTRTSLDRTIRLLIAKSTAFDVLRECLRKHPENPEHCINESYEIYNDMLKVFNMTDSIIGYEILPYYQRILASMHGIL